jgi:hypothetical protein
MVPLKMGGGSFNTPGGVLEMTFGRNWIVLGTIKVIFKQIQVPDRHRVVTDTTRQLTPIPFGRSFR